jgi:hypothetical protein
MSETTSANIFPAGVKPFAERKLPKTICMFDVDDTLTVPRQRALPEMLARLKKLREYTAVAIVGGSDLVKIEGQLHKEGEDCECKGLLWLEPGERRRSMWGGGKRAEDEAGADGEEGTS